MLDFTLPEDIRDYINGLFKFIDSVVIPLEKANSKLLESERDVFDRSGKFVPEVLELRKQVRMKSAEAGYYTMFGAEELGGGGLGAIALVSIFEAIYHRYGLALERVLLDDVVIPSTFSNGLSPVLNYLRPSLRDRLLPKVASGELTLCFGLSEPDAGSDVMSMRTRAVKKEDRWIINGTKQWITNGPYADYAMIFAITDPELKAQRKGGVTCFLVDCKSKGFDRDSVIPFMGSLGGMLGIISLDNVEVPEENIIGELNEGFKIAMKGVTKGRVGMSAKAVGTARWALEQAVEYANIRKTFGKKIGEHQAIQIMLAESAMDVYAAKCMLYNCAWKIDTQEKPPLKEISCTKAFCTE
ncbi:MAG: acyl-CoA dehydrogenase, partial [Syntrophomonadaceae bacterium]|nr:acyl-CoA dehydrogenase [Syntrophomonadaceae bacterium]